MVRDVPYFAAMDGVTVADKRFAFGKQIDADLVETLHPAVLSVLEQSGQLTTNNPTASATVIPDDKDPANMNRAELESAAMAAISAKMAKASDDDLRNAIMHSREEQARQSDQGGTSAGDYEALKDKPLYQLKTDELVLVAEREGVSLDGVTNNPDRIKAIEEARKSKSEG